MELPKEVLNGLRCNQCKAYLSCAPVFLKTNGHSICGRCTSPKKNIIRNEPYEKMAHLMKFPCKYDGDGCSEILLFSNIKAHETVCRFRLYKCTVQPDQCTWHGARNHFYEHCQTSHENDIEQNPYVLKHITTNIMKTVLVVAFNMLFMLELKVCYATKTIKYFVCLIGDPILTSLYKYDLYIKNNSADRLFKTGEIQQTTIQNNINIADIIDLNSILREDICDVTISFLISLKTAEPTASRMTCELCCAMNELPVKCKKHETYFCKNTSTCQLCDDPVTGYTKHYIETHRSQTYKTDLIFRITANSGWNWCVIEANFGHTLCKYKLDEQGFTILVYTPLRSHMLLLYNCEIVIIHTTGVDQLNRLAKLMCQSTEDWYLHIPMEDLSPVIVNNKVDLQINFMEAEIKYV